MFQPLFIDLFDYILVDFNGTLAVGGDRLDDYRAVATTYAGIGGGGLSEQEVVEIMKDLLPDMHDLYEAYDRSESDDFPSMLDFMRDHRVTSELSEKERVLLDRTIATREMGVIPPQNREGLRHLAATNTLALVSDFWGSSEVLTAYLREIEVHKLFDAVIVSSDHGCVKPSEQIFRTALDAIGSPSPEKCLMIGDNYRRDVVGARKLGMATILIAPTRPPEPECGDRVVARFEEVMRVR